MDFREIAHYLATGELLAAPSIAEVQKVLLGHLAELYEFMANIQVVVFHVNILRGTPKVYIPVMNSVKVCIKWKPQQNNIK